MAVNTQYGNVKQSNLAEYFIKKFNLVGRDAEYSKNRPTLAMMPRDTEKLKGNDGFYETVKIAKGWGGAPGWVAGNSYHSLSKRMRWTVAGPYAQFGRVTFDNLTLARNTDGVLMDVKGEESDDVKDNMLDTCEFELWSDGSGMRGQIATLGGSEATRVLTLHDANTVFNFPHGAVVYGSTTATGAGTDHSDLYRVDSLDPLGGTITCTQLTNTAGQELADEDYLFVVSSKDEYMPGIPTFIPSSDPADTLLGVTRTADPATSGWRFPFVNSISETIQRAFSFMGRWVDKGKNKYVVVLSTTDWLLLSFERESKIVYDDPGAMAKWGLEGLIVRTAQGPITCIAIPQVADGRGYILDSSSWKLYTLGNLPHVIDEDGQTFVRLGIGDPNNTGNTDGDGIALQLRIWKILLCLKPMSNATFPTRAS